MNGNNLFVDTNILLYLLQGDEGIVEILTGNEIYISFITELELLAFPGLEPREERKIQSLLKELKIIGINSEIKKRTIDIRSKYGLKIPDAIIAASAEYFKIPLVSGDKSFVKVESIDLIKYDI